MRALFRARHLDRALAVGAAICLVAIFLASCGGGGGPFGNPPVVGNDPAGVQGQKLSFIYFQKCIDPIFRARLEINQGGVISTNSCAGSGCHDTVNGTGGALRVVPLAPEVDLADPANTPDVMRTSDMYKNYYSAQGVSIVGSPDSSRLLNKPLVKGTLHGGGLIFENADDPNVKLMEYWISRPMPQGQDEFSIVAGSNMFTPPDPATGACNTQ
jgi:hypothetical protein